MNIKIIRFIKNEDGQGMVEYSLILLLVALAVVVTLGLFGQTTVQLYQKVVSGIPF